MDNKKENVITWVVLVILIGLLIYSITLINRPSGKLIQNLVNPALDQSENTTTTINNFETMPGDEKLIKNDLTLGTGAEVKVGDLISVHYSGTLENGTEFDSSYKRNTPFEFTVGNKEVIRGWDLGFQGMKVGGKRELIIPPELGYGTVPNGPIPANSTLKFIVELLDVKSSGTQSVNLNLNL